MNELVQLCLHGRSAATLTKRSAASVMADLMAEALAELMAEHAKMKERVLLRLSLFSTLSQNQKPTSYSIIKHV